MQEPQDVPPLPEPWRAPVGGRAPADAGPRGCGTPLLFGCGCLLLLLGVGSVAFTFKAKDILDWWFLRVEETLLEALPAEVTVSERQRLQAAFRELREALRAGSVDAAKVANMQSELGSALRHAAQGKLTREDVARLTVALEAVVRPRAGEGEPEAGLEGGDGGRGPIAWREAWLPAGDGIGEQR